MAKVNAYLAKREAQRHIENQALIKTAINRDWDILRIVLNRDFGFGKKRLNRVTTAMSKMYDQYVDAATTADWVYADEIFDREVRKIMGDE